ncbi:MAG: ATP-dependent Clp protease proteolytic subunit [Defluviitaleaceae bacterium]|nr:ATP-dependent Clp protease proteolytic subunit [Defluviitaleaceae bacterium]MCL2239349.1 ATP-dependent Clp protease proteolytic subunit [Defluviitaleaceae bacterium]
MKNYAELARYRPGGIVRVLPERLPGAKNALTADDPPCEENPPPTDEPPQPEASMPPPREGNPRGTIQFLTIIGQVEGHVVLPPTNKATKYEHVIPQLVMCAENTEVDGLLVLLNTMGGDVEAGLALSELIAHLGKPTVSLVLGGGHSIGVPLAVAADYSFIAPSATMTIHPIRMNGTIVGAPQTYDYFQKTQERVEDFITTHSRISNERLKKLMMDATQLAQDVGTILIGGEAVEEGLINAVGGLHDAMEQLYTLIGKEK